MLILFSRWVEFELLDDTQHIRAQPRLRTFFSPFGQQQAFVFRRFLVP
jgi:hypothetical protein